MRIRCHNVTVAKQWHRNIQCPGQRVERDEWRRTRISAFYRERATPDAEQSQPARFAVKGRRNGELHHPSSVVSTPDHTCSDNVRPSCTFCKGIGARCEYRSHNESSFDPSSLAILDRLSVLEALMREHNCTPTHASPMASRPVMAGTTPGSMNDLDHLYPQTLSTPSSSLWELHTGAESKVRLDTILQWPIFEEPLAKLPRSPFLTFKKEQDYTYLGDMFSTPVPPYDTFLNFPTDTSNVERLVDRFFILVHVKNPILDRDVVKLQCSQ